MAKRITYDVPIGMSVPLRQSVTAWARHLNKPRSEYCREILEKHQRRIGYFPPAPIENTVEQTANSEVNSPVEAESWV
jgi:predicted DNA-binding protein